MAELRALKPGNVHFYADGHRMQVRDFELSAKAAAPHIANTRLGVGTRIHRAIDATLDAVGCNTNLGIVLLSAPLAAASGLAGVSLREALEAVLLALDRKDAVEAFAAISRANPAGLGKAPKADVAKPANVTLLEAMALAARRDRIARAYVTGFADIFDFGLPRLTKARQSGGPPEDAVTALHMAYLGAFADSHIARKHGRDAARCVKDTATAKATHARPPIGPAARSALLEFDRDLKSKGLNPGTTADFVVATLFAETIISKRTATRGG
jgi:triphosphoribosyl-dephospho-CoA synthase